MIGELMALTSGLEGLFKKASGTGETLDKIFKTVGPGVGATGLAEPRELTQVRRTPPIEALRAGAREIGADNARLEGAGKRRKRLLMKGGRVVLGLAKNTPVIGSYVKPAVGLTKLGISAGRAAKGSNRFEVE